MSNSSSLILIVDDVPTNVKVLFEVLEAEGFRTLIAHSGEDALEILQEVTPDLILLDVMMPGINGFETCQQLKANPLTQAIPVIFMTALADSQDKVKGLKSGAIDYITKPFHQEEVLARVRIHLQLRQQALDLQHLNATLNKQVIEKTTQLVQSEKMSALGDLVAGVAHEINNPVSFIAGNISPALNYVTDLFCLIDLYQQETSQPSSKLQSKIEEIGLEFVQEDLPKLLRSMESGADRIIQISDSLRIFSRADTESQQPFDLHEGINSTLLILKHRLKANEHRPEIQVIQNYGDLPLVNCYPGQLNQVFMNLLANAIDALEAKAQHLSSVESKVEKDDICITVTTTVDESDRTVSIQIRDTGTGIPEIIQQRIFDHLFTTKPVGQGTGLGLAISRQIIVEKHCGKLKLSSVLGQATEFTIILPM